MRLSKDRRFRFLEINRDGVVGCYKLDVLAGWFAFLVYVYGTVPYQSMLMCCLLNGDILSLYDWEVMSTIHKLV